jgi:hypothetical protein
MEQSRKYDELKFRLSLKKATVWFDWQTDEFVVEETGRTATE